MGCDIHMYIEKRDDSGHAWRIDEGHTYDEDELDAAGNVEYEGDLDDLEASVGRSYQMFHIMAGVRSGEVQLFEARGVPDDASPEYLKTVDRWSGDGHTHSYLSLEEFRKCLEAYGADMSCKDDKPFSKHSDYISVYNYCKKWIEEQKRAQSDIIPQLHLEAEIRLVFF